MCRVALASVKCGLLRAAPQLAALDHVVELFVELLGAVGSGRSLAEVAARGDPKLFARAACLVKNDSRTDRSFFAHWLVRAMERALTRDDLAMIQAIHEIHPEPLEIHSLRQAIQYGTLETVQWLVAHRGDRICSEPGVENLCASCVLPLVVERDAFRIVRWLIEQRVVRLDGDDGHTLKSTRIFDAAQTNAQLTRWLHEQGLLRDATRLLSVSIKDGPPESAETVAFLIEDGYSLTEDQLVDALLGASVDPKMEKVLDVVVHSPLCDPLRDNIVYDTFGDGVNKVLQWDARFLDENPKITAQLSITAGAFGHLELLQWLWRSQRMVPAYIGFHGDIDEDAELRVFEWLSETNSVVDWASPYLLSALARRGHLRALQWLQRHNWGGVVQCPLLIDAAAAHGHLHILEWLHTFDSSGLSSTAAMDRAAENGHLEVVEWLHRNRQDGCTREAMEQAAANGHLHVLKFLHANRSEGCSASILWGAITQGHLEVVQWLVTSGLAQYGLRELILAAVRGHLEILAWLFERQDFECVPATLLCEFTRDPLHSIDPFRLAQVAARDTFCWLSDRYTSDQRCHGSYGHFYYEGQLLITEVAAQVGDLPMLKSVFSKPMPNLPTTENELEPMATKTGHYAFARWVRVWLEELYRRYA